MTNSNETKDSKTTKAKFWFSSVFAAAVMVLFPELASAQEAPFADELCSIAEWFTGDTGRAVATIAIIFLGIAAFFGKVTWGLALMFAVGVFAIFGAGEIVSAISDGDACSGA